MNNNQWNKAKVPFFLEVEYYDEVNPDTESKIMRSLLRNEDILPGLRVNQMFANCVDKNVLIADEIKNDLQHLQEEFEKFKNKYINFADDRSKDICMNKLGMKSNDFLDTEKHHAEQIKEVTKNNREPQIDSDTGRYKAYDDPTNFPQ
jgi:gas vesicle protein